MHKTGKHGMILWSCMSRGELIWAEKEGEEQFEKLQFSIVLFWGVSISYHDAFIGTFVHVQNMLT